MQIKIFSLIALLACSVPSYGAIAATAQWDVRSTSGNDANGGCFDPGVTSPGTNYSAQNSPQVAFTDLVIGATATQLTSVAHAFTSAYVGNCINVTGGSGFTAGWYEILSVSAGIATMDRAVGTAASTGGTGNLGGGLATLTQANTNIVASNTIWCQGTYTETSSLNLSQSTMQITGYATSHGDNGKCNITTSTNSIALLNSGSSNNGIQTFTNLNISSVAGTPGSGIWQASAHGSGQYWVFVACKFSGFNNAIDSSNGTPYDVGQIYVTGTEIANNAGSGINVHGNVNYVAIDSSYFHGNQGADLYGGSSTPSVLNLTSNIFSGDTFSGGSISIGAITVIAKGNTWYNTTNYAIASAGTTNFVAVSMNLYVSCGGDVQTVSQISATAAAAASGANAYYGGGTHNWPASQYDISLSVVPFVSATTGNFALNSTTGGGAALTGKGWPQAFGASTTNAPTSGAVQATSSSVVASGNFGFSN